MFTGATKIVKPEGQEADEFEQTVAQELFNLEVNPSQLIDGAQSRVRAVVRLSRSSRLSFLSSRGS